ncbi:MAG: hypothetical protein ABSH50_20975 [Bryobacteraceae bacterium]|jgi:hypothetical protein
MPDRDELDQIWRVQTVAPAKGEDMLALAMEKAARFERTIRHRNWRECGAAAVGSAFFGWAAWHAPAAMMRGGYLVVAASGLWIIFYMLRYGREAANPQPDQSLAGFQRALLRQYDYQIGLLRNVKYWYLLPMYAGLLLASAGGLVTRPARQPAWPAVVAMVLYTLVFGVIWWLNEGYAAGKLRGQRAGLLEQMSGTEA